MSESYLLFAGSRYYPAGGWEDFIGFFPTVEAAKKSAESKEGEGDGRYIFQWAHVVCKETFKVVLEGDRESRALTLGEPELEWSLPDE